MSFRGNYPVSVDAKGRLAIAKKFRDLITAQILRPDPVVVEESNDSKEQKTEVVVTVDISRECLCLYMEQEFIEKENAIMSLKGATQNKTIRDLQRLFVGLAHTIEVDKQGRILIPKTIQQYFELEKNMVLVGQKTRIEIWRESDWNAFLDDAFADEGDSETNEALNDLIL